MIICCQESPNEKTSSSIEEEGRGKYLWTSDWST